MNTSRKGFTVVELIVVTVVIAILAGISVFAFRTWRSNTARTEMKHDLTNAASALKAERNFKGAYPASLSTVYAPSKTVSLTYTLRSGGGSFCLNAGSLVLPSEPHYYLDSNTGSTPTTTACS